MTEDNALTTQQAADYMHVTRQAVMVAIAQYGLKAHKRGYRWYITREDMDAYRLRKFSRDRTKINGQYLWDIDQGRFSPPQIAKILSDALGRSITVQNVYHALRRGYLRSQRCGTFYVILQADAIAYLDKLRGHAPNQLELSI